MTQWASLGVDPAHPQAHGQGCPGADVQQNGFPVQPLLSFPLRVAQSLFHLVDLLRGAGDPLLAVSLSHAETRGVVSSRLGTVARKRLTGKQRRERPRAEVLLIFCRPRLTSPSSLPRFRPDSPAPLLAAGLLRCSVTPGGGAVDHWAARPSGEVWVEVAEEDAVPLRTPPFVCSATKSHI